MKRRSLKERGREGLHQVNVVSSSSSSSKVLLRIVEWWRHNSCRMKLVGNRIGCTKQKTELDLDRLQTAAAAAADDESLNDEKSIKPKLHAPNWPSLLLLLLLLLPDEANKRIDIILSCQQLNLTQSTSDTTCTTLRDVAWEGGGRRTAVNCSDKPIKRRNLLAYSKTDGRTDGRTD